MGSLRSGALSMGVAAAVVACASATAETWTPAACEGQAEPIGGYGVPAENGCCVAYADSGNRYFPGGYSTDGTCPSRPVATASDACPIVHSCGTDSHGCLVHRYENSCGAASDGCRTCPGTAFCDGDAIAVANGRAPCKPGATAATCRAAAYRQTCANGCRGSIVDARYPGGDLIAFAVETFIGDLAQLGCNELPRDGTICNGPRECHPAAEGFENLFCDQADRTIPGHCRPTNRPSRRPALRCDRTSSDCISVCGVLTSPPTCVYDEACGSSENCVHSFGSAVGFCLPRRLGRDLSALACP